MRKGAAAFKKHSRQASTAVERERLAIAKLRKLLVGDDDDDDDDLFGEEQTVVAKYQDVDDKELKRLLKKLLKLLQARDKRYAVLLERVNKAEKSSQRYVRRILEDTKRFMIGGSESTPQEDRLYTIVWSETALEPPRKKKKRKRGGGESKSKASKKRTRKKSK